MNCPYCKSENIIFLKDHISSINKKNYKLNHCQNCDLQFFTPLVFENVYETETVNSYEQYHDNSFSIQSWNKAVLKFFKKNVQSVKNKKILEVGAGSGHNYTLLNEFYNIGPDNYHAIELDKLSCNVLKDKGLKVIYDEFFNKDFVDKVNTKYDIIITTEVLEHQIDPKEFLESALSLLEVGGLLIISTPNRDKNKLIQKFVTKLNNGSDGDEPPHHFLKLNYNFYKKIFNNNLVYSDCYSYGYQKQFSSLKIASQKICGLLHLSEQLFFVFLPFIPILSFLLSFIKILDFKANILVVINKN